MKKIIILGIVLILLVSFVYAAEDDDQDDCNNAVGNVCADRSCYGTSWPWDALNPWDPVLYTGYCCGDDTNEYFNYYDMLWADNACNDITRNECVGKADNTNDQNCCYVSTDCVFGGQCISNGTVVDIDDDGVAGEFCFFVTGDRGKWRDCDSGQEFCEDSNLCDSDWIAGGESGQFGEYNTGTSTECCGDDAGEYRRSRLANETMDGGYSTDASDFACCSSDTDCINNNLCYANEQTFDVDNDLDDDSCYLGQWVDCQNASECPNGYICSNFNCIDVTPPIDPYIWNPYNVTRLQEVNIYGYIEENNVTITVDVRDNATSNVNHYTQTTNNTNLLTATTYTTINSDAGTTVTRITDAQSYGSYFGLDRFVSFANHFFTHMLFYDIGRSDDIGNEIQLNFTRNLVSDVPQNTTIRGWTTQYPNGWFNVSINLFPGQNIISVQGTDDWGNEGDASFLNIVYDLENPIINLTSFDNITSSLENEFVLSDNYGLNLSTLLINISEGSYNYYYTLNESIHIVPIRQNITCTGPIDLATCRFDINLSEGIYNVTISVNDSAYYGSSSSINGFILDFTVDNIASINDTGDIATDRNLSAVWSPYTDSLSPVSYYEYAVGNATYPDPGWDLLLNWSNTSSTSITTSELNLIHTEEYYIHVRAITESELTSNVSSSDGIVYVDDSPATTPGVIDKGNFTYENNSIWGQWESFDPEAGISEYELSVGTDRYPYAGWNSITTITIGNYTEYDIPANLTHGTMYYITARAKNGFGAWGLRNSSDGIIIDVTPPENGSISYIDGTHADNTVTLTLDEGTDPESNIQRSQVWAARLAYSEGECAGTYIYDLFITNVTGLMAVDVNIENGFCYKFKLITKNGAGLNSEYFGYSETYNGTVYVDATPPESFTVADEGSVTYDGTSLDAIWTEAYDGQSGVSHYNYRIQYSMNSGPKTTVVDWTNVGLNTSVNQTISLLHSNMTHQYKYYFDVKAVNDVGLGRTITSDGIIYIDLYPPETTLVSVEGLTQAPFNDNNSDGITMVIVSGEQGMKCVHSSYDIDYALENSDPCITSGILATCSITFQDGFHEHHIICQDRNGNGQDFDQNIDFNVTTDQYGPVTTIAGISDLESFAGNIPINIDTTDPEDVVRVYYEIYDLEDYLVGSADLSAPGYSTSWTPPSTGLYELHAYTIDRLDHISNSTVRFYSGSAVPVLSIMQQDLYYNDSFTLAVRAAQFQNLTLYVRNYTGALLFSTNNISPTMRDEFDWNVYINLSNTTLYPSGTYVITTYAEDNQSQLSSANESFIIQDMMTHTVNVSSSEPITLIYVNPMGYEETRASDNTSLSSQIFNGSYDMIFYNSVGSFGVNMSNVPVTDNQNISISGRYVLDGSVSSSSLRIGSSDIYRVLEAYAFETNDNYNGSYVVFFNTTVLGKGINDNLDIFIFNYDFNTSSFNYIGYTKYTNNTLDRGPSTVSISVDGFSLFVLTEDMRTAEICDSIDNDYDGSVDEGGVCPTVPSPSGGKSSGETSNPPIYSPAPPAESCTDEEKNQDETDVDCGGKCGSCLDYNSCLKNSDCISNYCYENTCRTPTCFDSILNQDETGIDCGGYCKPCATCFDNLKNQDETGVDCGGSCSDCESCTDGIKNQDETGVDCGGSCNDCESCYDGIKNQDEIEIDCGGPCIACPEPQPEKEEKSLAPLLIGLIILICFIIGVVVLLIRSKQDRPLEQGSIPEPVTMDLPAETPIPVQAKNPHLDVLKLQNYVNNMLIQGMTKAEISMSLSAEHWPDDMVTTSLQDAGDPDDMRKLAELKDFIIKSLAGNVPRKVMYEKLHKMGWNDNEIDLAIYNAHVVRDVKDLETYIDRQFDKGIEIEDVKDSIMKAGWPLTIVDRTLLSKHQTFKSDRARLEKLAGSMMISGQRKSTVRKDLLDKGFRKDLVNLVLFDIFSEDKNIDKLKIYVNDNLEKGHGIEQIRHNLIRTGWAIDIVNKVISGEFHKKDISHLIHLEKYIVLQLSKGKTKGEIQKHLLRHNWSDEFIDLVMLNAHTVDDDLGKVEKFIKTRKGKGDHEKKIKNLLLIVGWDEKLIEPLF